MKIRKILPVILSAGIMISSLTGCSLLSSKGDDVAEIFAAGDKDETATAQSNQTAVNSVCYDTLDEDVKEVYDAFVNAFTTFAPELTVKTTEENIELAYKNVLADHPEFFYADGYVYNDSSDLINRGQFTIYPTYSHTEDEVKGYIAKCDAVVNEWIKEIPSDASDYDISKFVFEKVVTNTTYKKDCAENQNMLSVFIFGQSVCGGYTQGYSYVMQKLGIPCATIYGTLDDTAHSWNASLLDGSYYLTDPTNGDGTFKQENGDKVQYINYAYLNIPPSVTKEYIPSYATITFSSSDDNYFVQDRRYFEIYSEEMVGEAIKQAIAADQSYITLCFGTEDDLAKAEISLFDNSMISKYCNQTTISYIDSKRFHSLTIFF